MKKLIFKIIAIILGFFIVVITFMFAYDYIVVPKKAIADFTIALESKDGYLMNQVYDKYLCYSDFIDMCFDFEDNPNRIINRKLNSYIDIYDEEMSERFNEYFCQYVTEDDLKEYLRDNYGTIFVSDDGNVEFGQFHKLESRYGSKCYIIEQIDEINKQISEIQGASTDADRMAAKFHIDLYDLFPCDENDTLCKVLEEKRAELKRY